MLARIDARTRIGVDPDQGVLAAARLINKSEVSFYEGDLSSIQNIDLKISHIDVLMALNFLQAIPFEEVQRCIHEINKKFNPRYIVVDGIISAAATTQGYKYFHEAQDFEKIGEIIQTVRGQDAIRDIFVVKLN